MNVRATLPLVCILGLLVFSDMAAADQVYLHADFNDKTVDQPIGTGGATVGEPIEVDPYVTAIVREGPMGSPSLEIADISGEYAGATVFEFPGGAEISSGIVNISADLWFPALGPGNAFFVHVRQAQGASEEFASIRFLENGSVAIFDANDYIGTFVGAFETSRLIRLILDYDMDAGTYDLWLDGTRLVDDRAHGVVGYGIGGIYLGADYDEDLEGYFNVDVVSVTDYFQAVATEEHSWGRMKAGFR